MARKQSNDPRAHIVRLAQSGVQLTTRQAAIYVGCWSGSGDFASFF